ncbi:MAG: restriction endonuclease, partial [Candidatus Micrarchaeaceae archaeon]
TMVNKNYIKGRNLEYLIKNKLEKRGFYVTRAAGSKGVDLIAIKRNKTGGGVRVLMVSCKTTGYVPPQEREELSYLAKKYGAEPLFTRKDSGKWELVALST